MPQRAFAAVALVLAVLSAGPVHAAELVMFDSKICPHCIAWHREIGPVYPRTDEGRLLPLRIVAFPEGVSADLHFIKSIRYTPTFVAIECGREVGRVVGYLSDEQFWGELSGIAGRVTGTC